MYIHVESAGYQLRAASERTVTHTVRYVTVLRYTHTHRSPGTVADRIVNIYSNTTVATPVTLLLL